MKIAKIEAGFFHCDGGAVFGVVPKRVWQKRYPCDEENFCRLAMRLLLIDTGKKVILIDSGTGDKQLQYLKYYGFSKIINFEEELSKLGYTCSEVTDVVMTHLHFDHCGGNTRFNNAKTGYELTFPKADVWVGKEQWKNFLQPNVREGDSYFKENMLPVAEAGKLKTVDTEMLLCEEVLLKVMNGHTVGQLVPYIFSSKSTFVYVGDVIPVVANLPLAWVSAYDTFPITSINDKEAVLSEAAEKDQILFFEHDAYTECCRVELINDKYRVKESFSLASVI
jgi:glyoxylase-like metal-dependent hydrolase (beta-lactamase superfamily II)